jgi:poly(3-hydroxybutyrate) depolymerase
VKADVEHLTNSLGIDRFFVSGLSGGAGFARVAALSPRA